MDEVAECPILRQKLWLWRVSAGRDGSRVSPCTLTPFSVSRLLLFLSSIHLAIQWRGRSVRNNGLLLPPLSSQQWGCILNRGHGEPKGSPPPPLPPYFAYFFLLSFTSPSSFKTLSSPSDPTSHDTTILPPQTKHHLFLHIICYDKHSNARQRTLVVRYLPLASFPTTLPRLLPHLSFILSPSSFPGVCLSSGASQASLQLALQADLCLNKTAPTRSASALHARKHTLMQTHKDARTWWYRRRQECQQGHERGRAGIQNDRLVHLSARSLNKEFPLFFPQPSILCLSDLPVAP